MIAFLGGGGNSRIIENERNKDRKRYSRYIVQNTVNPLMDSRSPCCGGGLSGICILNIPFII